ncbi:MULTISPECIES: phage tail protein, partial [unclassified Serratia (in: enterobacteria)]|uniref:phage tail protein n=1 Tax=unclassified Serratia (in: enterobacteria) TaxID=2647522 RepID=UPI000500C8F5
MAELIPVPPIDSDISLKALAGLAQRLSDINLTPLLVYLVDLVDSSTLPWLAEQLSLVGDGWELAESDEVRRTLIKGAIE